MKKALHSPPVYSIIIGRDCESVGLVRAFCRFSGGVRARPATPVRQDCTICDDAGGCGLRGNAMPVFPLSMSDFKPGDKEY